MSRYYDRQGRPIDVNEWVKLFKDNSLLRTEVGAYEVSTVYLGLDHNWGDGPPLIFETMIFGGVLDQGCDRWSTEAEARAGHDAAVLRCQAAMAASFGTDESEMSVPNGSGGKKMILEGDE